jgi:hypothetical protein
LQKNHVILSPRQLSGNCLFRASNTAAKTGDENTGFKGIPEYGPDGMGVSAVHGESVLIAGMIFDASIANGDNIVYSKIGSEPEDIRGIADTLRNNGYTTRFISVELPTEKALERNVNRFNEKRRLIDPE